MRRVNFLMVLFATFFAAQMAMAKSSKYLIELKGGEPQPGLAKSWKKVKDGEYEFELDTSKKLRKGPLTTEVVKNSLEAKLGSSLGVKVTPKGQTTVSVTYTGDEAKFLKKVSKTKIRSKKAVALALESSVSEGGIRAKTAERPPNQGEVKAIVIKLGKGYVTAKVNASKSSKIKGGVVKVATAGVKTKKGQKIFFVPEKIQNGVWQPKAKTFEAP